MKKKLKTLEQIKEEFKDIIYYKNDGSIRFIGKGHFILPEMKKYFGTVIDVRSSSKDICYNYFGVGWLDEWFEDDILVNEFLSKDMFEI